MECKDSLNHINHYIREMNGIDNLAHKLHVVTWDYIAVCIAAISLWVAYLAFKSQRETERNTMQVTEEGQFDLLIDYIRHFYANLVVIKAIYFKLADLPYGYPKGASDIRDFLYPRLRSYYPSEEHLKKLAMDTEALHPEVFVHATEKYNEIHNLLLLIRNYNIETQVAEVHVSSPYVGARTKDRDWNTLMFKQNLFCEKFMQKIDNLSSYKATCWQRFLLKVSEILNISCLSNVVDAKLKAKHDKRWNMLRQKIHDAVLNESISRSNLSFLEKKQEPSKAVNLIQERLAKLAKENEGKINYFTEEEIASNKFYKLLFSEETEQFWAVLNSNIYHELTGKNSQGFDKIAILTFDPNDED